MNELEGGLGIFVEAIRREAARPQMGQLISIETPHWAAVIRSLE